MNFRVEPAGLVI